MTKLDKLMTSDSGARRSRKNWMLPTMNYAENAKQNNRRNVKQINGSNVKWNSAIAFRNKMATRRPPHEISDFKCQISNRRFQISNVRFQIANLNSITGRFRLKFEI